MGIGSKKSSHTSFPWGPFFGIQNHVSMFVRFPRNPKTHTRPRPRDDCCSLCMEETSTRNRDIKEKTVRDRNNRKPSLRWSPSLSRVTDLVITATIYIYIYVQSSWRLYMWDKLIPCKNLCEACWVYTSLRGPGGALSFAPICIVISRRRRGWTGGSLPIPL